MAEYQDMLMGALKEAMRNRDKRKRDAIRFLQAELKQRQVDEQRDLEADEEMKILQKEAKKRRQTIEELEESDREAGERLEQEQFELALIEEFLPEQLTREEIEAIAKEAIDEVGAESMQDMGQVMGKAMSKTGGRADGNIVSEVVRGLLSNK